MNSEDILARLKENEAALLARRGACRPVRLIGGSHTKREVAKFSARDAECLDDYQRRLVAVANALRASVLETPPNVVEGSPFAVIVELFNAGRIANRIRALGLDLQRDFRQKMIASSPCSMTGGSSSSARAA
jgi:hypothetical protein